MKDSIFDLTDDPRDNTGTIFDLTSNEKSDYSDRGSFFSKIKDYANTIAKGSVEGLSKLGSMMGPYEENVKISPQKISLPRSKEELQEKLTEELDTNLPTEDDFGQKILRRGLREAPSILAMPGSSLQQLPRIGAGAILGQTAEELGAPEIVQNAAELTAFIGPDLYKKLLASGKNAKIIDFAKKMGMTDEQITPLIQSEFKQKWLSKLSSKKGQTEKALIRTKEGLGDVYRSIENSPSALLEISEKENGKLINSLKDHMSQIPREVQGKIEQDLADLINNKITGKSLMNFWKDINSKYGLDKKQLGILKEPIKKSINSISPELGEDFSMINDLYSKYYPIAQKLKPSLTDNIISAVEVTGILASLGPAIFGDVTYLTAILGEQAGKKVAQQLLINPRFQNLSGKIVDAMNRNKGAIAKKLIDSFASQMEKYSPEYSEELKKISLDDLESILNSNQKPA